MTKSISLKNGLGLDFSATNSVGIYTIGNLMDQTTNPPITSNASAIYFNLQVAEKRLHLIIGVDKPLFYGKYADGNWVKLL